MTDANDHTTAPAGGALPATPEAAAARGKQVRTTDRAEATAETRQRRRRVARDGAMMRMEVPPDILDWAKKEKLTLRWVNDDGTRLHVLTKQDDYDFVRLNHTRTNELDDALKEVQTNGTVRYRIGTKDDGSPQYAFLLAKPDEFVAEDRDTKLRRVDAAEKARLSGPPADAPDKSYTPGKR